MVRKLKAFKGDSIVEIRMSGAALSLISAIENTPEIRHSFSNLFIAYIVHLNDIEQANSVKKEPLINHLSSTIGYMKKLIEHLSMLPNGIETEKVLHDWQGVSGIDRVNIHSLELELRLAEDMFKALLLKVESTYPSASNRKKYFYNKFIYETDCLLKPFVARKQERASKSEGIVRAALGLPDIDIIGAEARAKIRRFEKLEPH